MEHTVFIANRADFKFVIQVALPLSVNPCTIICTCFIDEDETI
jgi:hypothetical protein